MTLCFCEKQSGRQSHARQCQTQIDISIDIDANQFRQQCTVLCRETASMAVLPLCVLYSCNCQPQSTHGSLLYDEQYVLLIYL
jgi:hypothetical protein